MTLEEIMLQLFREFSTYFYALGYFSGLHMIIIVSILTFYNKLNFGVYLVGVALNTLINEWTKPVIGDPRPKNPIKYLAGEKFIAKNEIYGFPSGHTQTVFFSIVYLYLTIHQFMPWVLVGLLLATATFCERWAFRNHTIAQLFAGAVVGSTLAYGLVYLRDEVLAKARISAA